MTIAIIGAMEEEVTLLREAMEVEEVKTISDCQVGNL